MRTGVQQIMLGTVTGRETQAGETLRRIKAVKPVKGLEALPALEAQKPLKPLKAIRGVSSMLRYFSAPKG